MSFQSDLLKLARENPELRSALDPALRLAASFSQVRREAVRAVKGLPKPKNRRDAVKNFAAAIIKTPAVMNWFYEILKDYGSISYNNTQDMLGDAAWAYRQAWDLDDDYSQPGSAYEGLSGDPQLVKLIQAAAKRYKPTKVDLGRDYDALLRIVTKHGGLEWALKQLASRGENDRLRKEALKMAQALVKALK